MFSGGRVAGINSSIRLARKYVANVQMELPASVFGGCENTRRGSSLLGENVHQFLCRCACVHSSLQRPPYSALEAGCHLVAGVSGLTEIRDGRAMLVDDTEYVRRFSFDLASCIRPHHRVPRLSRLARVRCVEFFSCMAPTKQGLVPWLLCCLPTTFQYHLSPQT